MRCEISLYWVEKSFHPSVHGPRKEERGNKGVETNKIEGQILMCDQLFCCLYVYLEGPFSQDGIPCKLGFIFNENLI